MKRLTSRCLAPILIMLCLGNVKFASAAECTPPPSSCHKGTCTHGDCKVAPPGLPTDPAPIGQPIEDTHPREVSYVPTCAGNGPGELGDALCSAALNSCPTAGDVRFWVYTREKLPQGLFGPWVLTKTPAFVCIAPSSVGVDPLTAVVAYVQAEWTTFALPAASVRASPSTGTLVAAQTRFHSDAPLRADLPPQTVLGYPVTLHVTATAYSWSFGDGARLRQAAGLGHPQAEHIYGEPGNKIINLETFYAATVSVEGKEYPLAGEGDVVGPGLALGVFEARTQLEAGAIG